MARAKRTDRTEARRRNRAEQAALAELESGAEGIDTADSSTSKSTAKTAQQPRPGIVASFRGAYRPLNLVGDLKAAPQVLTNWGFLAAIGITAAAAAWFMVAYNDVMAALPAAPTTEQVTAAVGTNTLPFFIGTMAIQAPPAIGAFLIGFTAKRASWLGGLVYGIFVVVLALVVLQTPAGILFLRLGESRAEYLLSQAAFSPVGSALFASAAAWYRRFLDLANPSRKQPRPARGTKPQHGRGNVKPNSVR